MASRPGRWGGLFAGLGGTGTTAGLSGGVTNVTAARIASILAAGADTQANALTTANAVTALKNVHAATIGADIGGDGAFTYTGASNPFTIGDGDTAIDGPIIATMAGYDATTVRVVNPTNLFLV